MIIGPVAVRRSTLAAYFFPAVALFLFVIVIPIVSAVRYSAFRWGGGQSMTFLGMGNYLRLVRDTNFWRAFGNNLFLIAVSLVGQVGVPLLLTVFFASSALRYKAFYRAVMFVPVVLSPVVIGILWSLIYDTNNGLLNWFLSALGVEGLIRPWLDDPDVVMFSVSLPLVWQYIGVYLVIFMSAIQGIPQSIVESAELDGAVGLTRLFRITLPLIRNTFAVAVMLCISGNMKVFDHIYVMTSGGPGTSSTVLAQYAYTNSFAMLRLGYGSAASVMILLLSLSLVVLSRVIGRSRNG